jgi:tetratricopeptide (TPR) repeat protein
LVLADGGFAMIKIKWVVPLLIGFCLAGCGPDTIFVRPGLDTSALHVANGYRLLERGKVDDAYREFERAKELEPYCVKAYVGLGLALGKKGDFDGGMKTLAVAERIAGSAQEHEEVQKGYAQLNALKHNGQVGGQ